MSETKRNPVIRVTSGARKNLKIIASYTGETMQEVVDRLAQQERERIETRERHNATSRTDNHQED